MFIFFYIMFLYFHEIMQIEINFCVIIFKISTVYFNIKYYKKIIIIISYLISLISFFLFLIIFNLHSSILLMHEFTLNKI